MGELDSRISLYVVRALFLLCSGGIGTLVYQQQRDLQQQQENAASAWQIIPISLAIGLGIIICEALFSRSSIRTISAIMFGLLAGFAASALFSSVIEVVLSKYDDELAVHAKGILQIATTTLFCYFGVTILLQSQGQFKFLIPFVEFRKELKGLRPIVVDTSVILSGHLQALVSSGFFESRLVVPDFVAVELQSLSDSADSRKRKAGERGLAILNNLKHSGSIEMLSYRQLRSSAVDEQLVELAAKEEGRILTRDQKLHARAKLEGVATIFLPAVLNALQLQRGPGDVFELEITREGEEKHQGVGYLEDGTMVVVDQAAEFCGKQVEIEIRRVVPTQSGRILFARLANESSHSNEKPADASDGVNS